MATIYFEGHANCRVKDGINIWIDPYYTNNPLSSHDWRTLEKPDLMLVTHSHGDHVGDAVEIVKETGAMLGCVVELAQHFIAQGVSSSQILNYGMGWNLGGTVTYKNTAITMFQAFHTSEIGVPTSFVVRCASGFTFYHAGDTSLFGDMKIIGELHAIDLAFLPIGDVFTMDYVQAVQAVRLLNTKAVMPMHYKTFPMLEQSTERFEAELERCAPDTAFFEVSPGGNAEYTLKK